MRKSSRLLFSLGLLAGLWSGSVQATQAQDAASAVTTAVPHVVQFSGTVPGVGTEAVTLRFALYATEKGGEPVWSETQSVTLDAKGRYSALLGMATPGGLPQSAFNHGEAKWLGISVGSSEEQPRTVLVATPYSLKASDAETVGGHPAADFLLAPRDANGKPETATPVTQINTSSGVLGGGTGPTVNLTLDTAYLTTLGNGAYAQLHAANTFTGNQTINGNLSVTGSGIVSNLLPGGAVDITHSGSVYTIGLDGPQAITFGNTYWAQIAAANLFKGKQTLAATGTATSSTAYNSNALAFTGSAYNSTASAPEALNFLWQLEPSGNNTTAPAGTLNLLYGTGTNAPAETGLKIGTNGRLTFASGQTFPGTGVGTITGITTSGALTGGGTSGSVALSVTASSVESTLGTYYAKTGAANTFTGNQTITGTESISGSASGANPVLSVVDSSTSQGVGISSTASATGILGIGASTTSSTGVVGQGTTGVHGSTTSASSTAYGMYGSTTALGSGAGVYGVAVTPSTMALNFVGNTPGMWADTSATSNVSSFLATADSNYAVFAVNNGVYASVVAQNQGTGGAVLAQSMSGDAITATAGAGQGVAASSVSSNGIDGVTSGTGGPAGVFGQSNATTVGSDNYPGIGISGNASGPSSWGVYGNSSDVNGIGVFGNILTGASVGDGVLGRNASNGGYGVHGIGGGSSSTAIYFGGYGVGVWADSGGDYNSTASDGAFLATADTNFAGMFYNNDPQHSTILVSNGSTGGTGLAVPVMTVSGRAGSCGINSQGDVTCSGRMKTAVPVAGSQQKVEVYSVQSSENWFEDFGTGKLENGHATVAIDERFAGIVNTGVQYHVFLTPSGNCKGLYVASRSARGFEVRELGDGGSSVEFDYRIVAKRSGHETERMNDVTAEMDRMMAGPVKPHLNRPDAARQPRQFPTAPPVMPAHVPAVEKKPLHVAAITSPHTSRPVAAPATR